jgi:diacylglycerol O-acyltransferase
VNRPLNGLERSFFDHEVRTRTGNLQIGGLTVFTGQAPSLAEFRAALVPRLAGFPVLTHAVAHRLWISAAELDFAAQVHEWVCDPGTSVAAAAERIMASRLTQGLPPWELWLIRGYADGEWAAIFKAHHALLDGASMITVLRGLLGHGPERRQPLRRPRLRTRKSDVWTVARGFARYLSRFLPLASPAFTRLSRHGDRRYHWATAGAAVLRAAADRHGVTVNDIYLAALTAAVRDWPHTPWRDGRPTGVWTLVPVDLHQRDADNELSAKVVNLRVLLPCDEPDPDRRLAAIVAMTRQAKGSEHVAVAGAGVRAMPAWFVRAVFSLTFSRRHISFLASNVRGPDEMLDYGGQPLRDLVPLGFLPRGHALGAYLMNHHDQVSVGFVVDESLPDGHALGSLWLRALDALNAPLAAHRG